MDYVWIAVAAIFGILIGVLFTRFTKKKHASLGTLLIDLTDPERDVFRLIVSEDLESLAKQTEVLLKVEVKTDSQ